MTSIQGLSASLEEHEPQCGMGPKVHIPLEVYKEAWKRVAYLKLLGKNVSLKVMRARLDSLWHLQWGCELVDLEEGFFVSIFRSQEDYRYVLDNDPWLILGHYLTITKRKLFFDHRLSGYSIGVSNSIGRPIKVDLTTQNAVQGRYARVCVKVQLNRPLTPTICLDGRHIAVEYDGLY